MKTFSKIEKALLIMVIIASSTAINYFVFKSITDGLAQEHTVNVYFIDDQQADDMEMDELIDEGADWIVQDEKN